MKLLLVEDDAGVREGMSDVLGDLAAVHAADSVPAALALLAAERFDLVVADLNIGEGGGGRTVLEAARERLAPVAIVSAAAPEDVARQLGPSRPDAVLTKPFGLDDMLAMVERFLGLRREAERLATQGPPPGATWLPLAPGVALTREGSATWVRAEPGAEFAWTLPAVRVGVWLAEGELELGGARLESPRYAFLAGGAPAPAARTRAGCLAACVALTERVP